MPEHTSFFSYLIAMFPALGANMRNLGFTVVGHQPVNSHSAEPIVAGLFVALLIVGLALLARGKVADYDKSIIPDDKLTLRTFFELLIGTFYDMMKDMMGPERAKRYFPIIGTAACFIFFSNFLGMIPGFNPPTSSWNVTMGCALVVFVMFNYYGIKENGLGYFKHLMGPMPLLAPLIFPLEVISLCLRPITLSVRLMLNMAVDHLLLSIVLAMFPLLLPIPIMVLGTLVAIVQVVVFCLLSSIYITLATEHEDHGDGHGHAKDGAHGAHAH
ncbi:MAG: F0F1 ATP synthase subunit A [Polyangiaceae bacterium]